MGADDIDDVMAEMAAETKRIKEAEAQRSAAITAAEKAAEAVLSAEDDDVDGG